MFGRLGVVARFLHALIHEFLKRGPHHVHFQRIHPNPAAIYQMTTPYPDTKYIIARTAKLLTAYNSKNMDAALILFVDEGLDYSDCGTLFIPIPVASHPKLTIKQDVMSLHMTKPQLHTFFQSTFAELLNMNIATMSIIGYKSFKAWKWELTFQKKEGASGFKDNEEGGKWKE